MEIRFSNKFEKELEFNTSKRTRGLLMAKKITLRLEQLRACDSLKDMRQLPGRCHELTEDRKGQFAVSLVEPLRLILKPMGNPDNFTENGSIIWEKIKVVEIIEIVNYHK
ncbi:MAG: killer suppression protein [Parcubacteria group bacterium]|nr:killer suppression protein [Parcubacteria group bacterium]